MNELAHPATSYGVVEEEPPELLQRNLNSAAHLLASATAFFFLAFLFAYFYLRSLDNAHLWKPKHVDPSVAYGTIVMLLTVACAGLVRLGLQDHRAGRRARWRFDGAVALGLGLAAVGVQVAEWATAGFGPADGGYASVFVGWTAFSVLFTLGALFWLENLLATAIRYRNAPSGLPEPGEASGDPERHGHDISDPLSLVRAGLESLAFYWAFLGGVAVLTWVVLYLA